MCDWHCSCELSGIECVTPVCIVRLPHTNHCSIIWLPNGKLMSMSSWSSLEQPETFMYSLKGIAFVIVTVIFTRGGYILNSCFSCIWSNEVDQKSMSDALIYIKKQQQKKKQQKNKNNSLNNYHHIMLVLYSGKLLREKTFAVTFNIILYACYSNLLN